MAPNFPRSIERLSIREAKFEVLDTNPENLNNVPKSNQHTEQ